MKVRIVLATSLMLAFASTAFAQDSAAPASASDAAAPAASGAAAKPAKKHHAKAHKAHVAGDPAKIDHSDDKMVVTPPDSKVTIPAGQQ